MSSFVSQDEFTGGTRRVRPMSGEHARLPAYGGAREISIIDNSGCQAAEMNITVAPTLETRTMECKGNIQSVC